MLGDEVYLLTDLDVAGCWHDMFAGESPEQISIIYGDMIQWMKERWVDFEHAAFFELRAFLVRCFEGIESGSISSLNEEGS